jgi:hypothetical protein
MKNNKKPIKELDIDLGINDFKPNIKIKIYFNPKEHFPFEFSLSHFVKTPTQADVYIPSLNPSKTEEEAIYLAKYAIENFVNGAIGVGYKPSQDWFIPNERF